MDFLAPNRRKLFSWLSLGLVGVLVGFLAVLQYNWIGEVSRGEERDLSEKLNNGLESVRRDFERELGTQISALVPQDSDIAIADLPAAYTERFARWEASSGDAGLFKSAGLILPGDPPKLLLWDREKTKFMPVDWPASWQAVQDWVTNRNTPDANRAALESTTFIDVPRFRRDVPGGPGANETNWLFLEMDAEYARRAFLEDALERNFGANYQSQYRIQVSERSGKGLFTYPEGDSQTLTEKEADGSISLFSGRFDNQGGGRGGPQGRRGPPPGFGKQGMLKGGPGNGPQAKGPPPGFRGPGGGRWTMLVSHQAGSLESIVDRARIRSLAISSVVLLLLLAAAAFLLKLTRQTERLAEAQMDFVAGVSHELRTPLAVIRTASYNLRGKMAQNPVQVEKYGALIQDQSEKLGAIVEQVLRFSSARAGQVLQHQQPLQVEDVIRESLRAVENLIEERGCRVETRVASGLPNVVGDSMALRHALQNLIANGLKYGVEQGGWLGVTADSMERGGKRWIEIRVADRGPGIPGDEQKSIFDAFVRGKKAVADQIHGTGLGLNLVKKIVEAHGGSIRLESQVGHGATFIVTLPVSAVAEGDELAHSLS